MAAIVRVLAPNPGVFTLEGTNTWIVHGQRAAVVIDPGPPAPEHLAEVMRVAGRVDAILLTHHHPDHAPGASPLSDRTGAPILTLDPRDGERGIANGEVIGLGAGALHAVATPGHTPDHVTFQHVESRALFTGDAVLGRGTSVIDPPEGDVRIYLGSLEAMLALEPTVLYPGHGPAVWNGPAKLREYVAHRLLRERQILDALRGGPRSARDVVSSVYADQPLAVHPIAARSVLAHLYKLQADGLVARAAVDGAVRESGVTDPTEELFDLAASPARSSPEGPATT